MEGWLVEYNASGVRRKPLAFICSNKAVLIKEGGHIPSSATTKNCDEKTRRKTNTSRRERNDCFGIQTVKKERKNTDLHLEEIPENGKTARVKRIFAASLRLSQPTEGNEIRSYRLLIFLPHECCDLTQMVGSVVKNVGEDI